MHVDLATAVQWFYRAAIKEPRDHPAAIAEEANTTVDEVSAAIDETRALFNLTAEQEAAVRRAIAPRMRRRNRDNRRRSHDWR